MSAKITNPCTRAEPGSAGHRDKGLELLPRLLVLGNRFTCPRLGEESRVEDAYVAEGEVFQGDPSQVRRQVVLDAAGIEEVGGGTKGSAPGGQPHLPQVVLEKHFGAGSVGPEARTPAILASSRSASRLVLKPEWNF